MGMNEGSGREVRVALVGAGAMATEHARAFSDVPGVRLSGIHSRTRARAEQLAAAYPGMKVCDSVPELYEQARAGLVVVAVPVLATAAVLRACLLFPWVVLVEKPPGQDLAEARDLHQLATERGSRVRVALNRNFLSSTQAALHDLECRPGIRRIHIQDQQDQAAAAATGHPPEVVHNWMFANSIHLLDYVRAFARGKNTAMEVPLAWDPEHPGTVLAAMRFDSGDTVVYEAQWAAPGPWAVSVATRERCWEMRPLECARYQDAGSRELVNVEADEWDRAFRPGFRRQAEEAVRAARGEPSACPTLADALGTMELIHSIYFNRRQGRAG